MSQQTLEQAVELIRAGRIAEARKLLEVVIREDRHNISAWNLYADTWPNATDKIRIWETCLRINPGNSQAQELLDDLKAPPAATAPLSPKVDTPSPAGIPPMMAKERPARKPADRSSQWLVGISMLVFIAMVAFAVIAILRSRPLDPEDYRHTGSADYYLYVPGNYTDEREWPLFVGIHGAGGTGLDCWNLWQSYADKEGFILLCPSIPGDPQDFYQDVGEQTVWNAVDEVKQEYRIQQRMFLSGFSAGGYFIQGFTAHYPQYVRALAIHAAGMYVQPSMFLEYVPMLVVIGGQDHPQSLFNSLDFSARLQNMGFDVQYVVLPREGHVVTHTGKRMTIDLFRRVMPADE